MFGLEFPPINELLRWQDIFPTLQQDRAHRRRRRADRHRAVPARRSQGPAGGADRRAATWPRAVVEFIEEGIVMQTIGKTGLRWTPFLLPLHLHLPLQHPRHHPDHPDAGDRPHRDPAVLALLVWVIYIGVGFKHQGLGYFGHLLWPPGVPTALKPLVGVIEFISTIIVRPFSPDRPTLRQHARRPHPARDVRPAHRGAAVRRDQAGVPRCRWASCRSAC